MTRANHWFKVLVLVAQGENVGGEVGKFTLCERDCRHWMLGQHNMRHDRPGRLVLLIRYLMKTRDVRVSLRPLPTRWQLEQSFEANSCPCIGSGAFVTGPANAGVASNKNNKMGRTFILICLAWSKSEIPRQDPTT